MKPLRKGCLVLLLALLFAGAGVWWVGFHSRGLNRDFDPEVVARAETKMWQAYYAHDAEGLGRELVTLMHEQLGVAYGSAVRLTFTLGKATMEFGRSNAGYEAKVLPGLITFYTDAHALSGGDWDPEAVAKAELAWWVARRTPGENSAEQVSGLIAKEYALLYGESNPDIEAAGLIRAQAAVLRDEGGAAADWPRIESMLVDSYTRLKAGVSVEGVK